MKKLLVGVVAAAFLLCSTAPLSAAELSNYGMMKFVGQFTDSLGFEDDGKGTSDFGINQRLRTWFDFTASENLSATLGIEVTDYWGNPDGLTAGGDKEILKLKHLYTDFTFPGTEVDVRAGQFWTELPSNFGSSILSGDMPGLQMNAPLSDQVGLTLGWTRPFDLNGASGEDRDDLSGDDHDILYAALPADMDGFSITPFGAYAFLGDGTQGTTQEERFRNPVDGELYEDSSDIPAGDPYMTDYINVPDPFTVGSTGTTSFGVGGTSLMDFGDDIDAWWLGVSGDVTMMDPIVFLYDLNYGKIEGDDAESAGYVADLAMQYRMDMLTFQVMGSYGSGDDYSDVEDDQEGGRMPVYYTESYGPTGLGYSNCYGCTGIIADGVFSYYQTGMWSVGMSLQDIAFSDKLTGGFQLRYNEGTNDKEMASEYYSGPGGNQMTEKDSAIEFGAQVDYDLYENLTATLDAGYINLDMDEDVWGQEFEEDITRIGAGLTYNW